MKNNSEKIIKELFEIHKKKNHDYGNSFDKSLDEDGLIAAKVRIGDKIRRIDNLLSNRDRMVDDESLIDTFKDLANYAIMTLRWIDEKCGLEKASKIKNIYNKANSLLDKETYELADAAIKKSGIRIISMHMNKAYRYLSEAMNACKKGIIPAMSRYVIMAMATGSVIFIDYLTQKSDD